MDKKCYWFDYDCIGQSGFRNLNRPIKISVTKLGTFYINT